MINVKSICDTIKNTIDSGIRKAAPNLSAIVMLCSLAKRPGLSTIVSVMRIVQKFKERGIPTEENEDGTPNLNIQLAYTIVDEIYSALRNDANVQGASAPGSVSILGNGENAGGPVVIRGFNTLPFKTWNQIL